MKQNTCPECNGEVVERRNTYDGTLFLGCRRFPKCRYSRPWEKIDWVNQATNADWQVMERAKARRLKLAGDIHCPRCDVGLLKLHECNRPPCEYKEDSTVET